MNGVTVARWVNDQAQNLMRKTSGLIVTVIAGRLYTERQVVYSFLYSLRQYIQTMGSQF